MSITNVSTEKKKKVGTINVGSSQQYNLEVGPPVGWVVAENHFGQTNLNAGSSPIQFSGQGRESGKKGPETHSDDAGNLSLTLVPERWSWN